MYAPSVKPDVALIQDWENEWALNMAGKKYLGGICGYRAELNDHTFVENQSLIPYLAAILGKRLPEDVRVCLKKGIERHLTEWGPATEHPESPKYESDGYWRGPIWAPSTYIAVCGMERCGYPELAREISKRFCAMCDRSGFAENFDALTGAPLRDPAYTWTSSAFLLMLKRL